MIIDDNGVLSKTFIEMQKDLGIDYAIEVGAHEATFSQFACDMFDVKSLAIEANPEVFNYFKDKINNNVQYINHAISNTNEIIKFKIHADSLAGLNSIKNRIGSPILQEYSVQASTLDSLVAELGLTFNSAALWIDCEGANKEVLLGAVNTLAKCSSVFIETEDKAFWEDQWLTKDVVAFLDKQGFTQFASEDVYTDQKNIIFIRRNN